MKVKLSDKVKNFQGCLARLYILQSQSFDNYPHWISHDETQAIWWQKSLGKWVIGEVSDLGKSVGGIMGPKGDDDYPTNISTGWKFTDGKGWLDANPFDIVCQNCSHIE